MCLAERRLTFVSAEHPAPFPSVLVYVSEDRGHFAHVFQAYGPIMQNVVLDWEYIELEKSRNRVRSNNDVL